jgi:hypothetical protein
VDGQLYYNTTAKKVYYYNATTSSWTEVGSNIYNIDGTLTSNRTVTLNGNTITFVGNTASLGVEFQSRVNVKGALTVSDFLTFNGSTSANKTIYANSLTFTTNNNLGYGSDQSIFTFSTAAPTINSGSYTTTLVNLLMPVNTGTQGANSRALLIDFSVTTNAGFLTAIQTVRGDNFFNSTDGNTYIGHSSAPSTTAKLSVNGTIQYTGNLISSGSGGNYTLSLRSGATANDFGRIVAYTNGASLTEMQSLEFGYYKTNLNSNYEFSNTNYNEWGFRVYGTITGTATGGGVYSSLLINPTLNITGNSNTSTYYGIRIAATETSTTNTTVIPFSYTHIGGTFTASNVIVNNSKIVKFTNSGASGNWGGGFGFYGGSNGNNGILALRVYSSGTADSNNAVMIGDVAEAGVQGSSIRLVVKSRVASGSESSYDDVQVIYTDSNSYTRSVSKILNGLVFGVGNASNLPSSGINGTYAVALGFQIDPLQNGWGTSFIISGKNDSGVMGEIARFTGKNKNLLVGTTTDTGTYKIEAAGLIRGTGLYSTTGDLVIGTDLNYSASQGAGNEGAVQVTGTTSGYSTKMIFRPYGNASGYNSNYWAMIEQNGTGFGISSGNYHNFSLYNGGSLRMTLLSADGTYSPYTNKVSITNNTGLGVLSITGSVGYSTITTSVDAVSGTLVPGTYYYRIVAFDESKHLSITSAQLSIVIPAGSSTNKVTITGITLPLGCRFYKVYRGTAVNNTYSYVSPTFDGASTFTDLGFVTNPGTYAPQNIPNTGTYAGFSNLGILYAKNFSGRQIVLNKELVTSDGLYVVSLPNTDSISESNMGSGINYVFGNLQYNNTSTWTGVNVAIGGITGALGYTTMSNSITIGSNFAYGGGLMTYTDSSVIGFSIGYAIAGGATVTRSTIIQNGTSQLWSSAANTSGTAKSVTSSFIWRSPWTGTGDYRLDSFPDTLSNVAIFGSYNSMINDIWFGNGGTGLSNIVNYTIHGSEIAYDPSAATIAAGGTTMTYFTNSAAGSITIAGGRGRGTGTGGDVILQTSSAAASGTTLQTLTSRWYIKYNTGTLSNVASPSASAALQIDSTTKGFLPPRMTTTDRNAIASPVAGLSIYNTTTNKIETWDGTVWNAHW